MTTSELRRNVLPPSATIREAMVALQETALTIVLVVDDGERLVGTLTDGDLRRALLAGATLESSVDAYVQRQFTSVSAEAGRAGVLELMSALRVSQVPIVDDAGRLAGLHLLHDLVGAHERRNGALIMAGGRGTRLAPLTHSIPKPMLRVAGRPILERIVLGLVGNGIRRIFIAVNYLASTIEEHFGDGAAFGCRIEYLRESRPLGTGGALSLLPPSIEEPLLVMNGDLVTQANLGEMLDAHAGARPAAMATVATRVYFHTVPFGCLEIDGDRVRAIEEKPTLSRVINAGIYVLDPKLIARVPADTEIGIPTLLQESLARGEHVRLHPLEDDWIDVGQHEQLRLARGDAG